MSVFGMGGGGNEGNEGRGMKKQAEPKKDRMGSCNTKDAKKRSLICGKGGEEVND